MCPRYFLILSEHCQLVIKEKDPKKGGGTRVLVPRYQNSGAPNVPDCLIHILQIIENWTNLVATRITILVSTENCPILCCDENSISRRDEICPILCCNKNSNSPILYNLENMYQAVRNIFGVFFLYDELAML